MSRGTLVPIGGAEEKYRDPAILRRFAELCGGEDARIAVIPTASRLAETGPNYERIFHELGVKRVRSLPIEQRSDCSNETYLRKIEKADGIFMTGGNQLRLSTTIGGTPMADLLRKRNAEDNLHVAGTSAGASFLSEHMIAYGKEGSTPKCDMVNLSPGLGLTADAIVDQHFRQRDRLGRLLAALAFNPRPIGIGLDEDTAAFIAADGSLQVAGSGAITVVDPSEIDFSSMDSARPNDPVCVTGIRLHVLIEGATFDFQTRTARPPSAMTSPAS